MVRSIGAAIVLGVALSGCTTWRHEVSSAAQRGDYVGACRIAAENQGDPVAVYVLGVCSEDGRGGMRQDMRAAVSYYTLAARYGVPHAQAQLVRLGEPIPSADLAARPQSAWLEAIGAGFSGMGQVAAGATVPAPPPALVPLYTPAVQTHCRWIGDLWTCTSR